MVRELRRELRRAGFQGDALAGRTGPTPSGPAPGGTTPSRNSPRRSRAGSTLTLATVCVVARALGLPGQPRSLRRLMRVRWGKNRRTVSCAFACGAWGYMETARTQWHEEQQPRRPSQGLQPAGQRMPHRGQPPPGLPRPPAAAGKLATDPPAPHEPPRRVRLARRSPPSRPSYRQPRCRSLQQRGVGSGAPGRCRTQPRVARRPRVFPHTTPMGAS